MKLESSDVIHSFWVPSLTGKMDAIPGRQNIQIPGRPARNLSRSMRRILRLSACPYGHAHHRRDARGFRGWRDHQIAAASTETTKSASAASMFFSNPCVMCHTVRGTSAGGRVAPDLTHVGSRRYIAAGTLETTRGNLAAWIVDPQGIKPGVEHAGSSSWSLRTSRRWRIIWRG